MSYRGISGQSAIEYLMTYGWMLLVVALTGGAIFGVAQSQTPDSVSGFSGSDVMIDNFGVSSDDELGLNVRSASGSEITVSRVNVSDPDAGDFVYKEFTGENRVGVGSSKIFELPNVSRTDSGNELNVEIVYDSGGLSNLSVTGSVSGSLQLTDSGSYEGLPEGDHQEIEESGLEASFGLPFSATQFEGDGYLLIDGESSSGSITDYKMNVTDPNGDSSISSRNNVDSDSIFIRNETYLSATQVTGNYNLKLEVNNGETSDNISRTVEVVSETEMSPNFIVSDSSPNPGDQINLDADTSAAIDSYQWQIYRENKSWSSEPAKGEFGEYNGISVSHTFESDAEIGTYRVVLTAFNGDNLINSATQLIELQSSGGGGGGGGGGG